MTDKEKIKEEIERLYKHYIDAQEFDSGYNMALDDILKFIDSIPEEHNEDLEEYAKKLTKGAALDRHNLIWMCKKGAEWQKQQMMKDAVEGTVKYEIGSAVIPQCDKRYQVLSDQVYIPNAKLGDKVKIIVLKTE